MKVSWNIRGQLSYLPNVSRLLKDYRKNYGDRSLNQGTIYRNIDDVRMIYLGTKSQKGGNRFWTNSSNSQRVRYGFGTNSQRGGNGFGTNSQRGVNGFRTNSQRGGNGFRTNGQRVGNGFRTNSQQSIMD